MTWKTLLSRARRVIAVLIGTLLVGGTFGTLAAMAMKFIFALTERDAWLFVGLPVAVMLAVFIWPRMSRISGFDDGSN